MISTVFLLIYISILTNQSITANKREDLYLYASKFTINLMENAPSNLEKEIPPSICKYSIRNDISYQLKFVNVTLKNEAFIGSEFEVEQIGSINLGVKLRKTSHKLSLVFRNPFDAEIIKGFIFNVIAVDNNNLTLNSCPIIVNIQNINDNGPWFDRFGYEAKFNEKQVLPSSPLIQVQAYDSDGDSIEYSLDDQPISKVVSKRLSLNFQKLRVKDLFSINEKTGVIFVGPNLGLTSKLSSKYSLTVVATDKKLSSSANVDIFLNDDNVKPSIKLNFSELVTEIKVLPHNYYKLYISELLSPKSFLATLIVYDENSWEKSTIKVDIRQFKKRTSRSYIREESNDFQIYLIKSNHSLKYSLMTENYLDREEFDNYMIFINATFNYKPSLESNTILEINLNDENDNAPKFSKDLYEFDLSSIKALDFNEWVVTGRIEATDADIGQNANIRYEIGMSKISKCKIFFLIMWVCYIKIDNASVHNRTESLKKKNS